MIRELMMTSGILVAGFAVSAAIPAYAQTSMTSVVREAVPVQRQVIVANSAEDIALQEEIRKIRAYNAYVNSQIGISSAETVLERAPKFQPVQRTKIELFEAPRTHISYASSAGTIRETVPVTTTFGRSMAGAMNHRIEEGDTLYGLARARCIAVTDIQDRNDLSDSNIRLGQVLALPESQCAGAPVSTEVVEANVITQSRTQTESVRKIMPVPTNVNTLGTHNYAVLPKDTLYSIGKQYCLNASVLAAHNGIKLETAIQPGQILRVPPASCVK